MFVGLGCYLSTLPFKKNLTPFCLFYCLFVCFYVPAKCEAIDMDVARSDFGPISGTTDFPEALRRVLRGYVLEHPAPGYVQGMSDLVEVLLMTLLDEASTSYCFHRLMEVRGECLFSFVLVGARYLLTKLAPATSLVRSATNLDLIVPRREASRRACRKPARSYKWPCV
jgi:hypothetical protein